MHGSKLTCAWWGLGSAVPANRGRGRVWERNVEMFRTFYHALEALRKYMNPKPFSTSKLMSPLQVHLQILFFLEPLFRIPIRYTTRSN